MPALCDPNDSAIESVVTAAVEAAQIAPVHVIGIAQQLRDALDEITQRTYSCEVVLPDFPSDVMLEPQRTSVGIEVNGDLSTLFVYSSDCSSEPGWHFLDETAPSHL
jgi:hypothetical protein